MCLCVCINSLNKESFWCASDIYTHIHIYTHTYPCQASQHILRNNIHTYIHTSIHSHISGTMQQQVLRGASGKRPNYWRVSSQLRAKNGSKKGTSTGNPANKAEQNHNSIKCGGKSAATDFPRKSGHDN